jgi:hypothetical protein
MAVVWEGIVGGEADQRFAIRGCQISTQEGNRGARRNPLARWLSLPLFQPCFAS